MTDRELMQMALDVLLQSETNPYAQVELAAQEDAAIEALRARLAQPEPEPINYEDWNYNPMTGEPLWGKQPEQEPVAWMYEYGTDNGDAVNEVRWYKNVSLTQPVLTYNRNVVPLYTAPPQREWIGLTDEEIMDACSAVWASHPIEVGQVVAAILKEKNGF